MHLGGLNPIQNPDKDWLLYHNSGLEIYKHISEGPFFLAISDSFFHYRFFSLLIGLLYTITLPTPIMTLLLNAILSALTIVFLYALSRSVGVTRQSAIVIGAIGSLYPSFLIFANIPLKEALVLSLAFGALLCLIQTTKIQYSKWLLLIPFIISIPLYTLREPFWYALMGAVTVTILFWWTNTNKIKRLGITLLFLTTASFSPILFGDGYAGINKLSFFATKERISYYREVVFTKEHGTESSGSTLIFKTELDKPVSFIKNYISSYGMVLLGPLPHQVHGKQKFILIETILLYLIIIGVILGTVKAIKKRSPVLILTLFSISILSVLALYIPNIGIIVRLRIVSILLLLPTLGLFFDNTPWIKKIINKIPA
ncbi:MAG: hypothetical protein HQ402_00925 [Parcubacteria group bacterium]|nr:hypothetical protein [Parcubacteria group bacterium]